MAERETELDVRELIERSNLGSFQLTIFGLCVLTLFVNGLNFSALNITAPSILRSFDQQTAAIGPVLALQFLGFFVGSILFGYVGDRFGRRPGTIAAVLTYSIPSLLIAWSADSIAELAFYRGIAGLGIGGLIPNVVALLNETAPKKFRVSFVMIAFVGYSFGNAAIARIGAYVIPTYAWSEVFLVAGAAGLVLSAVLLALLPESIPFLTATAPNAKRLRDLVSCVAPDKTIDENTRFVLRRPSSEVKFSLKLLFDEKRRIVTPLLWLAFFAETLTYITLSSLLTLLLQQAGLSLGLQLQTYAFASVGAAASIVLVALLIDRFGFVACVASALIAATATLGIGLTGVAPIVIMIMAVLAMSFGSATHNSLLGVVGGFYPTVVRANAVGYAASMGRVAGIVGPAMTSVLLANNSLQFVLMFIAVPDLIVAVICIALAYYSRQAVVPQSEPTPDRVRA